MITAEVMQWVDSLIPGYIVVLDALETVLPHSSISTAIPSTHYHGQQQQQSSRKLYVAKKI